jgi:hypothetical protein
VQLMEVREFNLAKLEELLGVVAARHPIARLGEDLESLGRAFETRATMRLLLELDRPRFFVNLQRAAQARRFFLRKSIEQSSTDAVFVALSRTGALFDCIASGQWRLAAELEELSPLEWMPAGEYEEDYCYHRLILGYVAGVVGSTDLAAAQPWRNRLAAVVARIPQAGLDASRLDICTSFLAGEEDQFWVTFEALVDASGNAAEAIPLASGRVFDFPWVTADRHVSIELLAWMALGRARGFHPPQREYRRCPSVAWIDGHMETAPDVFLELESRFGL